MRLCHEHRKCHICNLDLNAREQQWCYDHAIESGDDLESVHPRCDSRAHQSFEQDPTLTIKQSEYDYLNMLRLMIIPDPALSVETNKNNAYVQSTRLITEMASFEEKLLHLQMNRDVYRTSEHSCCDRS